jgi:pimeloyl-ACP methyl ester carboxylesterase
MYGPGNRGLLFATAPGSFVRAAGSGQVVFAGQVGGTLHVTILHPDGLRTSYSFLAEIVVAKGQLVDRGQVIAVAGATMHFGVRDRAGRYLDPALLLEGAEIAVVLVPGGDDGAAGLDGATSVAGPSAAGESDELRGVVAAVARQRFGPAELLVLRRLGAALDSLPVGVQGPAVSGRLLTAMVEWSATRDRCRQPDAGPFGAPTERRIAVLVGGLGSSSDNAAVRDVDTASLGYAPDDVLMFSYRGGRASDVPYGPADTLQDLNTSADRLAQLLAETAAAHPGVPIDVIAHSQGGVVARLAVERAYAAGHLPNELATVVTLGSPHRGAPLAGAASALATRPEAREILRPLMAVAGVDIDPTAPSVAQLAPGSPLLRRQDLRVPERVSLVSIAARGDLVVPAPRSRFAGQPPRVVPLAGPAAHDRLPGDDRTTIEIRAGIAGLPPRCRSFGEALLDEAVGQALDAVESSMVPH